MGNEKRLFTREEVKKQQDTKTNWIILHDKVYDVGPFLNEHPGGEEILADQRGRDGSENFDDVGHSEDAKELMLKFQIGELVEEEKSQIKPKKVDWATTNTTQEKQEASGLPYALIAVAVVVVLLAFKLWI